MTLWLALLAGCSGRTATVAEVDVKPEPIGLAECAVCGMVVGEQPSPRGQVLYRDGSHAFLCSLGDLRAQVQMPNPLGEPVAIWVESLPAEFEVSGGSTAPLDWASPESQTYVFGAERPLVMGDPVLSYPTAEQARAVAEVLHTKPVGWAELMSTPFHQVPAAAGVVSAER